MKQVKDKISNCKGETLVEVLASILIATLSVGMLASAILVSSNINKAAEQADDQFYQELTAAEIKQTPITDDTDDVKAIISESPLTQEVAVDVYGGEDISSYQEKTGG